MEKVEGKILLGHISGLFGVKGWVKIFSYTRPRAQIIEYKCWYLGEEAGQLVHLEAGRAHKEGVIAKFRGVDERDAAVNLLDQAIWVNENELSSLPEGEFYWYQLIGLQVIGIEGKKIGLVADLLETGANDVLIVQGDNKTEHLIPYIKEKVVKSVDIVNQRIVVDWDVDY